MSTLLLAVLLAVQTPKGPEIVAPKVAQLPVVDGKATDEAWAKAKEVVVKIDQPGEEVLKKEVRVKAVHDGASMSLLLTWADADKGDAHLPFVWKGEAYEEDSDKLEDSVIVAFALEGKFDSDMKAGIESTWDVWNWGSVRTPLGYAKDRRHLYSKTKPAEPQKSRRLTTRDSSQIFFYYMEDAGKPGQKKIEAPTAKSKDVVQQYELSKPEGSCADVEAKGEWAGGKWTVEFKRKLGTGNQDDAVFKAGGSIEWALATYDRSEKGDHDVSPNLTLKFE